MAAAAQAVEDALNEAGFQASRQDQTGGLGDVFYGMGEGFAEWIITAPGGRETMLQMAYFGRSHGPVTMDVGPVLDLEDLAGSKVCALASRAELRDYVDTAAALDRYTLDQLISFARRLDPGLTTGTSPTRASSWTGCLTGYSPATGSARRTSPGCGSGSRPGPGTDPRLR